MRNNNFDIVRLALATVVVMVHCSVLSQAPQLAFIGGWLNGELAVQCFFAISGFLIFASYERSSSLADYGIKRAYRILPAYWLSTALCLAIAFWHRQFHVAEFLLANLTFTNFLHPSVAGVFSSNPYTPILNGALWTIKIEVMFYVSVPVIVWLSRRLNRDALLWMLFAASVALRMVLPHSSKWSVELPGQLSFFIVGALIHYHFEWFRRNGWRLLAAAVAGYAVQAFLPYSFVFRPLAVGVLTLGAATLLPVIKGPTRWGDFSYGTYVLHWPIIQCVIATGLYAAHPWLAVGASVAIVAAAATFSWFVAEKPSLDFAHARSKRLKGKIPAIIFG